VDNPVSSPGTARWEKLVPDIASGATVHNMIPLRWRLTGYQQVFPCPLLIKAWLG
jgi:hypothetical protein